MKILVIGASGMLGSAMIRILSEHSGFDVIGSVRNESILALLPNSVSEKIIVNIDVSDSGLDKFIEDIHPDVVINCVGSVNKDFSNSDSVLQAISLNALLPHRLYKCCERINSRLIHISTDCVFSGAKGDYSEDDPTDPVDIYGSSKLLGEVIRPHAITIRTSIIGHELNTSHGLLEWFLSQEGSCKGYVNAIFSGLPTVILAEIIRDHVILNEQLTGLYNVAGPAISKYDLLRIIAKEYNKTIEIEPDESVHINRALNAERFKSVTGYTPPSWKNLIASMHNYK